MQAVCLPHVIWVRALLQHYTGPIACVFFSYIPPCPRTNFDCDNLEKFMLGLAGDGGSAGAFRGKREGGKEHPYSCVVLAGQRTMDERRRALQVSSHMPLLLLLLHVYFAIDRGAMPWRLASQAGLPSC